MRTPNADPSFQLVRPPNSDFADENVQRHAVEEFDIKMSKSDNFPSVHDYEKRGHPHSEVEFKEYALLSRKHAGETMEVIFGCLDHKPREDQKRVIHNPIFLSLIAFACELLLKSLLYASGISSRSHNLSTLFKELPDGTRISIEDLGNFSNIDPDEFEEELCAVGDTFVVFRYIYEREGPFEINGQFLIDFMDVLNRLTTA